MQALKIVLFSIIAAIVFGIIHDQFTVRICLEYFTIGHPIIFNTTSPTLLALGWGIIATWWVGLILGCLLATSARVGKKSKLTLSQIMPDIFKLLALMGIFSFIAGITGYILASQGVVHLVEPMFSRVPATKHVAFLTDLWAHSASYLIGVLGGIVLTIKIWRSRTESKVPKSP
ncbi:hypothetical protein [Gimesia aquarii]|uniref:Uncharacterized protein n=1 Tax=Gimesia aquarii TaxID=2527964 RepID=A0A517X230_9PLAN|nr:hypothetical protein [Gimesia aquarii]QDU11560.1 hypothetical protein V202x_49840 [Gimesia aquarii]